MQHMQLWWGNDKYMRLVNAHACYEALVCVVVLSQSVLVAAAWGVVCSAASYVALRSSPKWTQLVTAKYTVLQAGAWGSLPFVVSAVSNYCGSCVPPRRSVFASDPGMLLAVYLSAAAVIALLYTSILRFAMTRLRMTPGFSRLLAWPVLLLHFAAAMSPTKGSNARLVAPALFMASIANSLARNLASERMAGDNEEGLV